MAWTCIALLRLSFGCVGAVLLECAREGEFSQTMADHVFCYENRIKNFAVVDIESETDKIGRDHRAARPGLDRLLGLGLLRLDDLFHQMAVDKRAFFN